MVQECNIPFGKLAFYPLNGVETGRFCEPVDAVAKMAMERGVPLTRKICSRNIPRGFLMCRAYGGDLSSSAMTSAVADVSKAIPLAVGEEMEITIENASSLGVDVGVYIKTSDMFNPMKPLESVSETCLTDDTHNVKIRRCAVLYRSGLRRRHQVEQQLIGHDNKNATVTVRSEGKVVAEYELTEIMPYSAKIYAIAFMVANWRLEPQEGCEEAQYDAEYLFTLYGDELPSDINKVQIEYDFGDGNADSEGVTTYEPFGSSMVCDLPFTYEAPAENLDTPPE